MMGKFHIFKHVCQAANIPLYYHISAHVEYSNQIIK